MSVYRETNESNTFFRLHVTRVKLCVALFSWPTRLNFEIGCNIGQKRSSVSMRLRCIESCCSWYQWNSLFWLHWIQKLNDWYEKVYVTATVMTISSSKVMAFHVLWKRIWALVFFFKAILKFIRFKCALFFLTKWKPLLRELV